MRDIGTPGITGLVGHTPLLRVRLFERAFPRVEVYAKAEWFNPSEAGEGSDGAIQMVREVVAGDPGAYFYPDQYSNPANPRAHYEGTAVEILEQTAGRITHFVAGLGTTGTFVGTARRLKEQDASIRTIAVEPEDSFHGLERLKHLPTAIVPRIWDPSAADEVWGCPTEPAHA